MSKFGRNGFISQALLLLLLVAGLGVGSYLVTHRVISPIPAEKEKRTPETGFILKPVYVQSDENKKNNNSSKSAEPKDFKILNSKTNESSKSSQIKVNLLARSDTDPANLFVAKIKFPPDLLEVVELITDQKGEPFIQLWADKTFDNSKGTISLIGGIPTPGAKTSSNKPDPVMATLVFKPKKEGNPVISFEDTSEIFRNTDNINILTVKKSLELNISKTPAKPSAKPKTDFSPGLTTKKRTASSSAKVTPSPSHKKLMGDGNNDNKIDFSDVSIFFSHLNQPTGEHTELDFNKDGKINAFDSSSMIQLFLNISSK